MPLVERIFAHEIEVEDLPDPAQHAFDPALLQQDEPAESDEPKVDFY